MNDQNEARVQRLAPLVRRFRPGSSTGGAPDEFELWWNLAPLAWAIARVLPACHEIHATVRRAENDSALVLEAWESVQRLPCETVATLVRMVDGQRGLWELEEFLNDA